MGLISNLLGPTLSLINKHQRPKVFVLVVLLLLQALLDVISVASIAPLALLILSPKALLNFPALLIFYETFNFEKLNNFSIALLSAVVIFLVAKHFLITWIGNYKVNLAFAVSGQLSNSVIHNFTSILHQVYYGLKSSQELNRVVNLPTVFAHNILLPLTVLITEGSILVLLTTILLVYNTTAMVFLCAILIPAILFYLWNKAKITSINEVIKIKYPEVLEKFMVLFDNLIEIKLYQKENIYAKKIETANLEVLAAQKMRNKLFLHSTRLVETTTALCLCLVIGYFVVSGTAIENSIALISLFAAASVRAIPSFNRIFTAILEIKSQAFVVGELKKFQTVPKIIPAEALEFNQSIRLQGITFAFPGGPILFQNLSFSVRKGEKIALTGKSGSGKTTLLLILMQFLKGDAGEITIDGVKLTENHVARWRNHLAYVPQNPIILDASIAENISFGGKEDSEGRERMKSLLVSLGLGHWLSELPQGLMTRLGEKGIMISGGQRQRLAIARALYSEADVLLLDEITSQLDDETEQEVWWALQKISSPLKTIIMITHHPVLLKHFDSVFEL